MLSTHKHVAGTAVSGNTMGLGQQQARGRDAGEAPRSLYCGAPPAPPSPPGPSPAPGSNSLTCLPLLLPVPPKWLSLSLLPRSLLALPFPILPLLLPFRSDTSPPPPPPSSSRSQTRSPPTRMPSPGPPFRGRKNKQNQIKFTCCSRASSTGALSCPKSARRNLPAALQLPP